MSASLCVDITNVIESASFAIRGNGEKKSAEGANLHIGERGEGDAPVARAPPPPPPPPPASRKTKGNHASKTHAAERDGRAAPAQPRQHRGQQHKP